MIERRELHSGPFDYISTSEGGETTLPPEEKEYLDLLRERGFESGDYGDFLGLDQGERAEVEQRLAEHRHFRFKIRKLKRADIYFNGFLKVLSQLSPVDLDTWKAISTWLTRTGTGFHTIVASTRGDRVVGTASYFMEPKFIYGAGRVGHIEEVVVDQEFRGKGVGKALVKACVDELRRLRCYKIILNSSDENAPFYEGLGFRRAANTMRIDL